MVGFLEKMDEGARAAFYVREREELKKLGIAHRISGVRSAASAAAELALACKARRAVLPMQDILLSGGDTRMNVPSVSAGNWCYRLEKMPPQRAAEELRALVSRYGRI